MQPDAETENANEDQGPENAEQTSERCLPIEPCESTGGAAHSVDVREGGHTAPPHVSNLVRLRELLRLRAMDWKDAKVWCVTSSQVIGFAPETSLNEEDMIWALFLRIAKDRWAKRQESFTLNEGYSVAVRFNAVFCRLEAILDHTRAGPRVSAQLVVRVLRQRGIVVEARSPPADWTQVWDKYFCIFPLGVLREEASGQQISSSQKALASVGSSVPLRLTAADMLTTLKGQAEKLRFEGKTVSFDGKSGVRVSDLRPFYPPWDEVQMAQYFALQAIPTARIWDPTRKVKIRVWFAWD